MATANKLVKYISKISRKTYKKNTELQNLLKILVVLDQFLICLIKNETSPYCIIY